jgi:hypothetical protein
MNVEDIRDTVFIKKTYFPDYVVAEYDNSVGIGAYIRKQHQGKWYRCTVVLIVEGSAKFNVNQLSRFMKEAYQFQILGKVNLEATTPDGYPVFELDEIQDDEVMRLINSMKV